LALNKESCWSGLFTPSRFGPVLDACLHCDRCARSLLCWRATADSHGRTRPWTQVLHTIHGVDSCADEAVCGGPDLLWRRSHMRVVLQHR
jgi:hypothetical protein